MMVKTIKRMVTVLPLTLLVILTGCATTNTADNRDPIEGLNRAIFSFNDSLDKAVFKPVAQGYRDYTPDPLQQGVGNFFGNIEDVVTTINDLLQFKFKQTGSDGLRVLVNTTLGIFGIFDVATRMGFEKHNEDFGQTLGRWGIDSGPYLVLPVLGPSTLRDTVGIVVDNSAFDPIYQIDHIPSRNSLIVVEGVDNRAELLGASKVLEKAALDRYNFLKESYLQKRENDVQDSAQAFDLDSGEQAFLENPPTAF